MKAQLKVQSACDITIGVDHGSLRLQFPNRHKQALEAILGRSLTGKPNYLPLGKHGFKDNPVDHKRAAQIAIAMESDLDHPEWDKLLDITLAKYGIGDAKYGKLATVTQLPGTVPALAEITVGTMWEAYLQWKKTVVEETTFKTAFTTLNNIIKGIVWNKKTHTYEQYCPKPLGELTLLESDSIRTMLLDVVSSRKNYLFRELNQAFEFCESSSILIHKTTMNPFKLDKFNTPVETTQQKYASQIVNGEEKEWHEVIDEAKAELDRRAFTKVERDIIIQAFYSAKPSAAIYAPLIEFYFLTGCRTSEALPLTWKDIDFGRNTIRFSKSMGVSTRKIKETKTGEARLFYFSENSRLRELLLKLKSESSSDLVFTSKKKGYIPSFNVSNTWRGRSVTKKLADGSEVKYHYPGIVTQLAQEGAIGGYLSPYHTRHTYITLTAHANSANNNALLHIASSCGNSVDVILRHYLGVNESIELVEV